MEINESEYSPFDAPVRELKTLKPETSGGIKMEQIPESEVSGEQKPDIPTDAPTFEIPTFAEIPSSNSGENPGFGQGDPNAPGSSSATSSSGGGGNNAGTGGPKTGGGSSEETKVDPAFAREFSEYTAKWLIDIFFKLVIGAFVQYAKINTVEVKKAINEGSIDPFFSKFIEDANYKVERDLKVSEDEKKFVIEPLKYFLEVKKVQLKPEWMFLTSLAMVTGSIAIKAHGIKTENKVMLDKIIKESQERRAAGQTNSDKRTPEYREETRDFSSVEFNQPVKDSNIQIIPDDQIEHINNDDNAQ